MSGDVRLNLTIDGDVNLDISAEEMRDNLARAGRCLAACAPLSISDEDLDAGVLNDMVEALKGLMARYDFDDELPPDHPIVAARAVLAKLGRTT
jgi:hypothetical protein